MVLSCRVGKYDVKFPYAPHGSQLSLMWKIIATLDYSNSADRNANAILEMPKIPEKTLTIISAALAWQESQFSSANCFENSENGREPERISQPFPGIILVGPKRQILSAYSELVDTHHKSRVHIMTDKMPKIGINCAIVLCSTDTLLGPSFWNFLPSNWHQCVMIIDDENKLESKLVEAASCNVHLNKLEELMDGLRILLITKELTFCKPLLDVLTNLASWLHEMDSLVFNEREEGSIVYSGKNALPVLESIGVSVSSFQDIVQVANKILLPTADDTSLSSYMPAESTSLLAGLVRSLELMLTREHNDYTMVVQWKQAETHGLGHRRATWGPSVGIWCLNPSVAFEAVKCRSRNIILSARCLSPVGSLSAELQTVFHTVLEWSEVVNAEKQIFSAILPTMSADSGSLSDHKYLDDLGAMVLKCCSVIPDGTVVYVPSFDFLAAALNRWRATGLLTALAGIKRIFTEPEQGEEVAINRTVLQYCETIEGREGAVLFSVYGGMVPESSQFADKFLRGIILVGIPFPCLQDLKVGLKAKFNNGNKGRLCCGDVWRSEQAFRSINSAIGRIVSHKNDFGAILCLDSRFQESSNRKRFAKWVQPTIREPMEFDAAINELIDFFKSQKNFVSQPAAPFKEHFSFFKTMTVRRSEANQTEISRPIDSQAEKKMKLKRHLSFEGIEKETLRTAVVQSNETAGTSSTQQHVPLCSMESANNETAAGNDCNDSGEQLTRQEYIGGDRTITNGPQDEPLLIGQERPLIGTELHCKACLNAVYISANESTLVWHRVGFKQEEAFSVDEVSPKSPQGDPVLDKFSSSEGEWYPEDGCVYRKLHCKLCGSGARCCGVLVEAADKENFCLVGKVLFFPSELIEIRGYSTGKLSAKGLNDCRATGQG